MLFASMSATWCAALRRVRRSRPWQVLTEYRRLSSTSSSSHRQFVHVPEFTEWIEHYVEGGFHPVHLGDVLKDRYRILRKLGNGGSATVWLAKDEELERFVAMKINAAWNAEAATDGDILTRLYSDLDATAAIRLPVPILFDSFELEGPNGTHQVQVMEPFGGTLQDYIAKLIWRSGNYEDWRDIRIMKRISRQMIQAVCYIHRRKIVHRDIQAGNFIFALEQPLEGCNEAELNEHTRLRSYNNIYPISRIDGQPLNRHCPEYLVEPQPLEDKSLDTPPRTTSHLVLSDFGAATTFENADDGFFIYPLPLRSPEILLELPVSEKSDVWALGCTIFYLVTLSDVFWVDSCAEAEEREGDHLQSMIETLGILPENMLRYWSNRHSYVDKSGRLLPQRAREPVSSSLEDQISKGKPPSMSLQDAAEFVSFLRYVFQYDSVSRPSAEDLPKHPWLVEGSSQIGPS